MRRSDQLRKVGALLVCLYLIKTFSAESDPSPMLPRASSSTSTSRSAEEGVQGAQPSASSAPATTTHSAKAVTNNSTSKAKMKKEELRRSQNAARKRPFPVDSGESLHHHLPL